MMSLTGNSGCNGRAARVRGESVAGLSTLRPGHTLFRAGAMLVLAAVGGCSSSSAPKPQVVSIAVTDANGNQQSSPLTSLTVNTAVYLDVTLNDDTSGLGADWTVACGSATAPGTPLPPGQTVSTTCGTFTPVHTLSAPVPDYVSNGLGYVTLYTAPAVPPQGGIVTLYAAAVADPSRYASLAFPIVGLPISIGFAPQPPASLAVGGTASLKAVVSNDYTPKGVTWTVICGSSACGSFAPAQTASGVATVFTAPAVAPAGGTVTVAATSVTDPTKSVSATITIAPVSVSVAPAALSVATDATAVLNATVANDVSSAGVDWSLACGSGGSQGACGSITTHTASGTAATYTAPSEVPSGGTVTLTATASADKTATAQSTATITATATPTVSGTVREGKTAMGGAAVLLYAAGEAGYGSASTLLNDKSAVTTEGDGRFTVTADMACPKADSLLYVVARGSVAEGGLRAGSMIALGPCNRVASGGVVLDEVTTVAAAYSLAAFMRDGAHVGAAEANRTGLVRAFATANELVDSATGEARAVTPERGGIVPRETIDALANGLNRCSAGCGTLMSRMAGAVPGDTIEAALAIARRASEGAGSADLLGTGFVRDGEDEPFQPTLAAAPDDWMLRLTFPDGAASFEGLAAERLADGDAAVPDRSGNLWVVNRDGSVLEIVGAAGPRVR